MPRPQYCCPQVYPAKQAMPSQPHDLSLNGMRHYDVDVCSRSVRASETVEFKPIRTYLKQEGTRFHTLKNVRFSLFVCRLILKMHCVRSSHAMTNIIARIAWNVRSVATIPLRLLFRSNSNRPPIWPLGKHNSCQLFCSRCCCQASPTLTALRESALFHNTQVQSKKNTNKKTCTQTLSLYRR